MIPRLGDGNDGSAVMYSDQKYDGLEIDSPSRGRKPAVGVSDPNEIRV